MGGVGLALPDTLGDPFGNPAAGSRLTESVFFGSPTFYGISDRNGSGRSLPLGALFTSGDWFGGAALSLQELKGAERNQVGPVFLDRAPWSSVAWPWPGPIQDLSEASARNVYAFGMAGLRLPHTGLSLGVSGSYPAPRCGGWRGSPVRARARKSTSRGSSRTSAWESSRSGGGIGPSSFSSCATGSGCSTTSPISTWSGSPSLRIPSPFPSGGPGSREKPGPYGHLGSPPGVPTALEPERVEGGMVPHGEQKGPPKIPNYEIQNIPRDPGDTGPTPSASGIAKTEGPARFAADLFLEPIRSETWADAAADTTSALGEIIRAGERPLRTTSSSRTSSSGRGRPSIIERPPSRQASSSGPSPTSWTSSTASRSRNGPRTRAGWSGHPASG